MSSIMVCENEAKGKELDISVLIATYNRAETLRETLERMARLDREGLSVEFVVVDNNSSDNTKHVIESFRDLLPVRYLFEPRSGKNCALNKALDEVELGKLVVFTDDDVEPDKDWLTTIVSVSDRWPDYSVFGGKVYVIPPVDNVHTWLGNPSLPILNLGAHEYAGIECPYSSERYPVGANLWLRRETLDTGGHFCETLGPSPKNRIMGSETSLVKSLRADGYEVMYSPYAVVGHRVSPDMITASAVRKRAYRCGRQGPHLGGLCRRDLYRKHPFFWRFLRIASLIRAVINFAVSLIHFSSDTRILMSIQPMIDIGYNVESLRLVKKN